MSKKAVLSKVLDKLSDTWPPANGIKLLIRNTEISDEVLDWIISTIKSAIDQAKTQWEKEQMLEYLSIIQDLRKKELKQKEIDDKEADELLTKLDSI